MSEIVLVEKEGSLALITLNRPEKLNALDYALIDRLMEVLDAIEDDDGTRALVLTGAGNRAFSSGADIACFAASVRRGQAVALREFVRRGQRLTARIETFPKPIIAAVNGLAHGGGCEITEAAPLAIASDRAEFCKAEINLGFAPPFGGTQRLPRLIGRKRALRMILTAEPITASEACALGLVNDVVPHERLLEAAFALAHKIAGKSTFRSTRVSRSRRTTSPEWCRRAILRKDSQPGLNGVSRNSRVARFSCPSRRVRRLPWWACRSVVEGPVRSLPTL
jgi:enoyl-CoA hydratase/carnithine racemase